MLFALFFSSSPIFFLFRNIILFGTVTPVESVEGKIATFVFPNPLAANIFPGRTISFASSRVPSTSGSQSLSESLSDQGQWKRRISRGPRRFSFEENNDDQILDHSDGSYSSNCIDDEYLSSLSPHNTNTYELVWEKYPTVHCGTAHVLLPPPNVKQPSCVVHFIGGTFFGSAPSLWYRTLLEDIVLKTNAAIIATSIPVTLLSSPLQHVQLANKCTEQFRTAYRDIILLEYCSSLDDGAFDSGAAEDSFDEQVYKFQKSVPICAIGHSLGARLLVVLTTMCPPLPHRRVTGASRWWQTAVGAGRNNKVSIRVPPYQNFILISFTNYGASTGIPGLYQLSQQSLTFQKRQEELMKRKTERMQKRTRKPIRKYNGSSDIEMNDDDDNDNVMFEQFTKVLRQSKYRLTNALTPNPTELEFHPTPQQLWKAISRSEDGRYRIPQTLIVQLDNDPIDQSTKFCNEITIGGMPSIVRSGIGRGNPANSEAEESSVGIKFARLRGNHLTPIAWLRVKRECKDHDQRLEDDEDDDFERDRRMNSNDEADPKKWLNEKIQRLFNQNTASEGKIEQNGFNNHKQHLELRQTVSRYINEIVAAIPFTETNT